VFDLRVRPAATALLTTGALLLATGCGSDEAPGASGPTPTAQPAPTATGATETPVESASARRLKNADKDDPQRVGERKGDPDLPASKGNDLEAPKPTDKLGLSSSGADGLWRISSSLSDTSFCVKAATPGPNDPTPLCSDPTAAALTLSTSDGGAQVSVDPIRETARGKQTKLLVWGIAQRAVPSIRVKYAGTTKTAKLSDAALALKVDEQTAKALGSEADLKTTINVRTFGVTFDLESGNPPKNASADPSTPNGKPVTFTLQ
jgi:hypothetical protein